jgi:hypothetical protein
MRPGLRPWLHATAVVGLVNGVFLLLALWAAGLPRDPFGAKIERAFASGELIENDWPWLDGRRGFNQYHDCSILQMISNRDAPVWLAAVGPVIYNRGWGETERCATLRVLLREGPDTQPYIVYRYTRYWHGYIPVTAALLSVFELREVRRVLEFSIYGMLVLLVAAGRHRRKLLAVAAAIGATGIAFWSVRYFGKSLTHGPGDLGVIGGLVVLLFWRDRLARRPALIAFCAVYGSVVAYLEFLTALLPTAAGLLVPLVYILARLRSEGDNAPAQAWRLAGTALLAFAFGAALTIGIKQILALILMGPTAATTFVRYLLRYINPSPAASMRNFGQTWTSPDDSLLASTARALYELLGEGYVLTYGSHTAALVLFAASALAWMAAGWLAFTRRRPASVSDFFGFAAGVAIILAWALAVQTHTMIHKWWMVRMMLVPLAFGWGALAWQLLAKSTGEDAGSPTPLPT